MPPQKIVINGEEFEVDTKTEGQHEKAITTRIIRRRPWWKRFVSGIKALWGSK